MPLRYAACSLPPVTSRYWPNSVLLTIHANSATSANIRRTWNGTPATLPSAIHWNAGLLNACRLPSVTTCAMPRPAMNSTSVATIGCTASRVTRKPLNTPHRAAARIGSVNASTMPSGPAMFMNSIGASAPEIAIDAPTDKIDAARRHDQRHADPDDHDRHDLRQIDVEGLQRPEVMREEQVEHDHREEHGDLALDRQTMPFLRRRLRERHGGGLRLVRHPWLPSLSETACASVDCSPEP